MIAMFMGGNANSTQSKNARAIHVAQWEKRDLVTRQRNGGKKTPAGTKEAGVAAAAGEGASSGKSFLSSYIRGQRLINNTQVSQQPAQTDPSA